MILNSEQFADYFFARVKVPKDEDGYELSNTKLSFDCKSHPSFIKSFRCVTCSDPQRLCLLCVLESHNGHAIHQVEQQINYTHKGFVDFNALTSFLPSHNISMTERTESIYSFADIQDSAQKDCANDFLVEPVTDRGGGGRGGCRSFSMHTMTKEIMCHNITDYDEHVLKV